MPGSRLPLDLHAEVTTADGTKHRWDANQAPGSRLTNATFSDKIGEGFSAGGGQLARRIDQDYPDASLVNTVTMVGADESVAYEGRISAMPRELGDRHSIGVTLTGWMAHARDRKFQEIYVDRSFGGWTEMTMERRGNLSGSISTGDFSWSQNQTGPVCALPNQALGAQTIAELWYQAPTGVLIGKVAYQMSKDNVPGTYVWRLISADSRNGGTGETYTGDETGFLTTQTLSTARRYAYFQVYSNGNAVTPAAGANRRLPKLGVYGTHGLTARTGESGEPDGFYASDVIRNIASRFCPEFDTSGVQDTSYVIQHIAYLDPTDPYDAFLDINKYHLWHLGVWEGKRLDFRPYDLTDYDWEIRTDDPGTTFQQQGSSIEDLYNGIAVTYTDLLTGATERLTPDAYSELRDSSTTNPWNKHGILKWGEITLSRPTLGGQALQVGRATLADWNRPKAPGKITVRGYIRDRAGNYQPYWKVRSGDTIAITNHPNDQPRLIVETSKNVEAQEVQIAVDRPFAVVEAALDRVDNALFARGLV